MHNFTAFKVFLRHTTEDVHPTAQMLQKLPVFRQLTRPTFLRMREGKIDCKLYSQDTQTFWKQPTLCASPTEINKD